jgi:hypothetical protein
VTETGRIFASFLLAVVGAGAATLSLAGCPLKNCEATFRDYNVRPGATPTASQGLLPGSSGFVDDVTWQSGSDTDQWIDFPGQRVAYFYPSDLPDGGRVPFPGPYEYETYVSADQTPTPYVTNFTIATGNLAELNVVPDGDGPGNWKVVVHNDTCAPYFLRLVLRRPQADAGLTPPAPTDASTDGAPIPDASDASALDAGTDASPDAPDGD